MVKGGYQWRKWPIKKDFAEPMLADVGCGDRNLPVKRHLIPV
jgi:hypothetical protein